MPRGRPNSLTDPDNSLLYSKYNIQVDERSDSCVEITRLIETLSLPAAYPYSVESVSGCSWEITSWISTGQNIISQSELTIDEMGARGARSNGHRPSERFRG
jgi:hypothetical protein